MKTLIKILLALVVVIVVLLAIGVFALFTTLDSIAKSGIEEGATYTLGVETTLDSADVQPFSGKFSMAGLKVSNPEGFDAPHFLSLAGAGVEVDYSTLQQSPVMLPVLRFEGIDLWLQKKGGEANYERIIESLKRFERGEPKEQPKPEAERKLVVQQLVIDGVTVHVDLLPVGGALTQRDVTIEKIELSNIGSDGSGVTPTELVKIVSQALLAAVRDLGPGVLPPELISDLEGQLADLTRLSEVGVQMATELGDLEGKANEAIDRAKEELDRGIQEGADKLKEGIEGLVPGRDRDGGG